MNKSKIITELFTFVIILTLLFLTGWTSFQQFQTPFIQSRELCLQFFEEDTLYGGQPYCVQGSVTYTIAFLIQMLPLSFDISLKIFALILLFFSFHFLCAIKEKETNNKKILFLCFLFLFIFIKENDFATVVALFFLVMGFYYFSFSEKTILGSFFLSLALFSKLQTLFLVIPVYLFFFLSFFKKHNEEIELPYFTKLTFWKDLLKKIIPVLSPPIFLFVYFYFRYDYFLEYYYLVHLIHPMATSLSEILRIFPTMVLDYGGMYLILSLGIAVTLFRLIQKKFDVYSFICLISLPFFFIKVGMSFGPTSIITLYRYFLLFVPFYLLLMFKVKEELYSYQHIFLLFFMIIVFTIPLVVTFSSFQFADISDFSIFNDQKISAKIKTEFIYPLFLIKTEGKVLISKDYPSMGTNKTPFVYLDDSRFINIDPSLHDNLSSLRPDMTFAPQFVTLGILSSLDEYTTPYSVNNTYIQERLGEITAIIQYPDVDIIDSIITTNKESIKYICRVYVPIIIDLDFPTKKNTFLTVYFFNDNECLDFYNTVKTYYSQNYEKLCSRGEDAVKIVDTVMNENGIPINKSCQNYSKVTRILLPAQIQELYFYLFIVLFLLITTCKTIKDKKIR